MAARQDGSGKANIDGSSSKGKIDGQRKPDPGRSREKEAGKPPPKVPDPRG
jgi:hypothetical protein